MNQNDYSKDISYAKEILDNLYKTYEVKNADYGHSFDKSVDKYGDTAYLLRSEDKTNRLENILNNKKDIKVKDETLEDTILDRMGYDLLYLIRMKRIKECKPITNYR